MEIAPVEHRHDAPGTRAGLTVDLRALLERVCDGAPGEGLTASEVADQLGCGMDKARRVIKAAVEQGRCRVSKKRVTTLAGHSQLYPSYVFEVLQ